MAATQYIAGDLTMAFNDVSNIVTLLEETTYSDMQEAQEDAIHGLYGDSRLVQLLKLTVERTQQNFGSSEEILKDLTMLDTVIDSATSTMTTSAATALAASALPMRQAVAQNVLDICMHGVSLEGGRYTPQLAGIVRAIRDANEWSGAEFDGFRSSLETAEKQLL